MHGSVKAHSNAGFSNISRQFTKTKRRIQANKAQIRNSFKDEKFVASMGNENGKSRRVSRKKSIIIENQEDQDPDSGSNNGDSLIAQNNNAINSSLAVKQDSLTLPGIGTAERDFASHSNSNENSSNQR